MHATECVTDLDQRREIIIFGSILTTIKLSSIFGGSWGSIENWFNPKTERPSGNLALPKSVKHSVATSVCVCVWLCENVHERGEGNR